MVITSLKSIRNLKSVGVQENFAYKCRTNITISPHSHFVDLSILVLCLSIKLRLRLYLNHATSVEYCGATTSKLPGYRNTTQKVTMFVSVISEVDVHLSESSQFNC